MKKKPIAILIVEDHPVVRRGLKEILADEYPRAVFGEAANAPAAMDAFRQGKWDMVLLDIQIPGRGGLDVLADMLRLHPQTKVLVVSAYPEEEFAVRAFKLCAAGYLSKNEAADELVTAAKKLLAGGTYVRAALAERMAGALGGGVAGGAPHESLSPRELLVLRLVAGGRSAKQIAAELALSEKTVGTYRARIAEKTGLATHVELTRYAFQHGLTQ